MEDEQDFHIWDPRYSVYRLKPEHSQTLQRLFEQCADFNMIVHGEDVSPTAAQEIFQEVPPGRSIDDKFLFGIKDRKGELIGMVEGLIDYPDDRDWWIGLMLLAPGWRGQGLGRMIVEGFSEYVRSNQGKSIMLGVVDENQRAYSFWQQAGFKFVRETEPRKFSRKIHTVYVMRRVINLETTPE
jgi:ribosomal protein S18 acetylase RimI-like enzyme